MSDGHRLRVAVIFGGPSAEHEVSLRSAAAVLGALDRNRFEPIPIGVDPLGGWHLLTERDFAALGERVPGDGRSDVALVPGHRELFRLGDSIGALPAIDVVFPVVHGPGGEDGSLQGLLESVGVPYVGPGVLGSALGMDKSIQKRLLRDAGLPVVPWVEVTTTQWRTRPAEARAEASTMGLPLFVKPAALGSSVGVTCVEATEDIDLAIEEALRYDDRALIECAVDGREIECAVLGNERPEASVPGEIVPGERFYSYRDKYAAGSRARLLVPAPLSEETTARVQDLAVTVFTLLRCSGMARVDFFLDRSSGLLFVNEINTIPGFTSISMYPRLWEASGLSMTELISRLIDLALERFAAAPARRSQSSSRGS